MTIEEIWKPIPDFPRYEVSNLGRVRSWAIKGKGHYLWPKQPKIKKLTIDAKGRDARYVVAVLFNERGPKTFGVHNLVLTAFVGPRPPSMDGCHNDDDVTNNHLDNLRWDTRKGNFKDRTEAGHTIMGETCHLSKLTEPDVLAIRARGATGEPHKAIAADYGITRANVSAIIRRTTWKHVDPSTSSNTPSAPQPTPRPYRRSDYIHAVKGQACHFSKLTESDVLAIRARAAAGEHHGSIAADYHITRPTVSFIVARRTWKHV